MTALHFNENERARLRALMQKHSMTEYAVIKRLVYLGLERIDAGEVLIGSGLQAPIATLEKRMNLVLSKFQESRARDFNMTLELLEHTIWLRTLGERLDPGGQAKVDEQVGKAARMLLPQMDGPPPLAKSFFYASPRHAQGPQISKTSV